MIEEPPLLLRLGLTWVTRYSCCVRKHINGVWVVELNPVDLLYVGFIKNKPTPTMIAKKSDTTIGPCALI